MLVSAVLCPLAVIGAAPASATVPSVQDVAGTSQLNAITCPTSTSCVAVGSGLVDGTSEGVVVPISNGTPGTPQDVSGVTNLTAVACATATQCDAIGGTNIVPITGGSPGTPQTTSVFLESVACASSSNCVAVGNNGGPEGVPITDGVVGSPIDYPANEDINLVTCPTSSGCNGYGMEQDTLCLPHLGCMTSYYLVVLTLGPDGTFVSENQFADAFTAIYGVSCPNSTTCYGTAELDAPVLTILEDTGPTGGAFGIPNGTGAFALACPSVTTCVATGQVAVSGGQEGAVAGINNVVPSTPVLIPGVSGPGAGLSGVSCATTTTCFAVGASTVGVANEGVLLSITLPTTTVLVPAEGSTLSEPGQFDASASSPGGVASVYFEVTGGNFVNQVICPAHLTYFGWFGQCTTTTVSNGTYTLQSVATNTQGFMSTSAPVTVTVNHPLPTTTVLVPSSGGTESGADSVVDASASANVTSVLFELTGGSLNDKVIATGTPTVYGWLAQWNTTTIFNGSYTLQSVAYYASGESTTSTGTMISIDNPPPASQMLIPSNGATESGAAALLDAANGPNDTVDFFSITSSSGQAEDGVEATLTPYGWLGQWNTESVPNGMYTIASVAIYPSGQEASSAPVTVTVNNPLPTTAVLVPSAGASVSGTAAALDASVSGESGGVTFELTGGSLSDSVIATATPTEIGWLAQWNSTTVPDGNYSLQSVDTLTYQDGTVVTVMSPAVSITVSN